MYFAGAKMNFYKLIKQQFEDRKNEYGVLHTSCNHCPCKTLRDEIIDRNGNGNGDCTLEMIYLVNKYNIKCANVFSCYSCMSTSVKIAKKLFEKEFNKI